MILQLNGVSFRYRSTPVLDGVTFTARPGEILAVLGNNGAGKSTLLKCINRILRPHNGAVLLAEDDIKRLTGVQLARRFGRNWRKKAKTSTWRWGLLSTGSSPMR